jgi:DNA-binding IscR family transcriptional regulator
MTSEFIVAVNCMVFLKRGGKSTSGEMAKAACTNASRVRRVMSMLKKGGLICTREGAGGGYILCRPPGEITLGAYMKKQPSIDMKCMQLSGMHTVMEKIHVGMEENCMSYLKSITLKDILLELDKEPLKTD